MSTESGTPGDVRIMMPPALPRAVCCRATGSGTFSRSRTSMALACSAEITARLRARAPREWSRAVVTVAPFFSVVAYAPASRTTTSGVISTLRMPDTPRAPKRCACPRDSQMTEVLTNAPASMVLKG